MIIFNFLGEFTRKCCGTEESIQISNYTNTCVNDTQHAGNWGFGRIQVGMVEGETISGLDNTFTEMTSFLRVSNRTHTSYYEKYCLDIFINTVIAIANTNSISAVHFHTNSGEKPFLKCCREETSVELKGQLITCVLDYKNYYGNWVDKKVDVSMIDGRMITESSSISIHRFLNGTIRVTDTDARKTEFYEENCVDYTIDGKFMAIVAERISKTISKCCDLGKQARRDRNGITHCETTKNTYSFFDNYNIQICENIEGPIIEETKFVTFSISKDGYLIVKSLDNEIETYPVYCIDHDQHNEVIAVVPELFNHQTQLSVDNKEKTYTDNCKDCNQINEVIAVVPELYHHNQWPHFSLMACFFCKTLSISYVIFLKMRILQLDDITSLVFILVCLYLVVYSYVFVKLLIFQDTILSASTSFEWFTILLFIMKLKHQYRLNYPNTWQLIGFFGYIYASIILFILKFIKWISIDMFCGEFSFINKI